MKYETGNKVRAVNNKPLEGNDIAPPLEIGKEYPVGEIFIDKAGNQHLDVGIKSQVDYIRSWETKEYIPRGNEIWWCHPSRFELVT